MIGQLDASDAFDLTFAYVRVLEDFKFPSYFSWNVE